MAAKQQLDAEDGSPGKMGSSDKLIIRPEKARLIDVLSLLLLRRPLTSYPDLVEVGDGTAADLIGSGGAPVGGWFVGLTVLVQKLLNAIYWPAWCANVALEFLLNFVALNSGVLGIIWNILRCKLVIPWNREAPNFRSIIAMVDGRTELKPAASSSTGGRDDDEVATEECIDVESGEMTEPLIRQRYTLFEVTVMAAKLAYENAAYIENVVNNVWKFHVVGFYSCWNKFMGTSGDYTTQAFVATERSPDARVVLVAFRGTEPLNAHDWSTDVNLSWLRLGTMGRVHAGFLKALGLQEEDGGDPARAFPRDLPAPAGEEDRRRPVAYYALREVVRRQLGEHPGARLVVTGHSLGGALAALFPALLALHGEAGVLRRLRAVHTYGQPRVGDAAFAAFYGAAATAAGGTGEGRRAELARVVYRYDAVPRVPFDLPPLAWFRHGGACVYYDGWYRGRRIGGGGGGGDEQDVPDRNYFDPRFLASKVGNAAGDLVKGALLWAREGRDSREGAASLLLRAAGLAVPGLASHSPRDYVNAVRLGTVAPRTTPDQRC